MAKSLRLLWPVFNVIGIVATVLGMFGVIGLIELGGSMFLFVAGMILIAISAAIVFYDAQKMGILKDPACCFNKKCDSKEKQDNGDEKDE
ncbi:MAG: hypothetical protein AB7S83_01995 [Candidatus Methanomethylophilaceae archaeon]|jgi:hypothetical protein